MSGPCRARVRVRVVEFSYYATKSQRATAQSHAGATLFDPDLSLGAHLLVVPSLVGVARRRAQPQLASDQSVRDRRAGRPTLGGRSRCLRKDVEVSRPVSNKISVSVSISVSGISVSVSVSISRIYFSVSVSISISKFWSRFQSISVSRMSVSVSVSISVARISISVPFSVSRISVFSSVSVSRIRSRSTSPCLR